jgi:peptidoglycan/xylan/chitin deacetylase (PgdA/CDA1 family)
MSSSSIFPEGRRAALSLSFDDARLSQIDRGMRIFDERGVRATFYVSFGALEKRIDGWRAAVKAGHEIGNHTVTHPCTGNFPGSRNNALEDYTPAKMEAELTGATARIRELLGVTARTFAYPCGNTFIGRGESRQSYVPLVARHFDAARGWPGEVGNDPMFCDLHCTLSAGTDGWTFEQMRNQVTRAIAEGKWVVLVGHEIGDSSIFQTTSADALEKLCDFCRQPEIERDLWTDTFVAVADHLREARSRSHSRA